MFLYNSDFFRGVQGETLIQLADRAVVKTYIAHGLITEQGDTCRELLLLMEGSAQIQRSLPNHPMITQDLLPGRVLDELEVLAHTQQSSTIVATATPTRLLAIPVDTFDDLLERDCDFARRVLAMESTHLQQLIQQHQVDG
ncbi:cyclic nucleotide-binding domain-containing protein [Neosynechococcus sphagnicola]|uniref:cyclic nucleotide-binding domain-containing protein n=1 Tax=Neosynechococcus sphagnicola TaxID=1501145 RepID=UPI001EFA05DE|nr:cyclic nucleotide-binding domain-containing protein [Neosynechococcus sphagnicola]